MTLADMEQRGNELKHPTSASHWQFYSFFVFSSTAKLPAQTVFVMSLHAWSFYPHPFNILLDLTVKWPPLIACLCLAMAAVASVLWTNIRGNYVRDKNLYETLRLPRGKYSYFWCCFINDLGDISNSVLSFFHT